MFNNLEIAVIFIHLPFSGFYSSYHLNTVSFSHILIKHQVYFSKVK